MRLKSQVPTCKFRTALFSDYKNIKDRLNSLFFGFSNEQSQAWRPAPVDPLNEKWELANFPKDYRWSSTEFFSRMKLTDSKSFRIIGYEDSGWWGHQPVKKSHNRGPQAYRPLKSVHRYGGSGQHRRSAPRVILNVNGK